MKRTISSALTLYFKVILPGLFIWSGGIGGIGNLFGLSSLPVAWAERFFFLLLLIVFSAFIGWLCLGLKKVKTDGVKLYVSNYFKEIVIPLNAVTDVTENKWINIHPVTIHLKTSTEFGDQIKFMPHVRLFTFFSSHPIVGELKKLAKING